MPSLELHHLRDFKYDSEGACRVMANTSRVAGYTRNRTGGPVPTERVLASGGDDTATIDVSLPRRFRPTEAVESTVELTGGVTDRIFEAATLVVMADGPAASSVAFGPSTATRRHPNRKTRRVVIQRRVMARDLTIHAADRRKASVSLDLSPYLPLSLGRTRVSVAVTPNVGGDEFPTHVPIDVRPTARMQQVFHALLDLEYSLLDTGLTAPADSSDADSAVSEPVQTLVFAPATDPLPTEERLVVSFDPSADSLDVEVTVLDGHSDGVGETRPNAVDESDHSRPEKLTPGRLSGDRSTPNCSPPDRPTADRLTVRNTDGEAVRADLAQLLGRART